MVSNIWAARPWGSTSGGGLLWPCGFPIGRRWQSTVVVYYLPVPVTMLGEVLQPDMFEKLRHLESFREYEAKVKAEGKAEADAAATSRHLKDRKSVV